MLSRFLLRGSQSFRKSIFKLHPNFTTSAIVASDKKIDLPAGVPREYPNPTSKRDFINYPKLELKEEAPPVRFFFIPESFFTFMYPKTGYTGFHIFLLTLYIYVSNKEYLSCGGDELNFITGSAIITLIYYKFGGKIKAFYEKALQEESEAMDRAQEVRKIMYQETINDLTNLLQVKPAIEELIKVNTDIIYLQMENAFRDRIMALDNEVQKKLNCFLQIETIKQSITLKYLKDFIMKGVMSSITPEMEKSILQNCINDLSALAAKA